MKNYEKFREEYLAPVLDFGIDKERDILDKVDKSNLCYGCKHWIKSRLTLLDFHYVDDRRF